MDGVELGVGEGGGGRQARGRCYGTEPDSVVSSVHVRARLFDQSRVRGDEVESHALQSCAAVSLSTSISSLVRKDGLLDVQPMARCQGP